MFKMPLAEIKQKLVEKSSLSKEEIDKKIKKKLDQLSGLISEEGAAHIVANELGVKLIDTSNLKISNLNSGMRNIDITGKVTQVYEVREFQRGESTGKVANFILADETGALRAVLWNDQADKISQINQGDVVSIQSGYVRESMNNKPEIHLNDYSKILINPKGKTINIPIPKTERKKLSDITENDQNVEVLATIVQVYDPRFFEVCPECGKRAIQEVEGFICKEHSKVIPKYSYLLNAYLDDGSSNMRTVFFREHALNLLDISDEEMLSFKENPLSFEEKKNDLLGTIIKVTGRVNVNKTFGSTDFVANKVILNPDPEKEIQNLSERIKENKQEEKTDRQEQEKKESQNITENTFSKTKYVEEEQKEEEEELYSLQELEEAIE